MQTETKQQFTQQLPARDTNMLKKQNIESEKGQPLIAAKLRDQDEIYQQPKVMRNSNSHYDSLMQQVYQKESVAKSSYNSRKNSREEKQEIGYLKHSQHQNQFIAYSIVSKQSNSGIISHQRFMVLDSHGKELRYYSNIPKLPLKSFQDVSEQPKEVINLATAKKLQIHISKRGIGELELSWVEGKELKEWKLKMGSAAMAREWALIIEEVRNGRKLPAQRQTPRSTMKSSFVSAESKQMQVSSFSTNIRKSQISSTPKNNSSFANQLLKSMLQPHFFRKEKSPQSRLISTDARFMKKQKEVNMKDSSQVSQNKGEEFKGKKIEIMIPPQHLELKESITDNSKSNNAKESVKQQLFGKKQEDPSKAKQEGEQQISINQIIKDASIQRMEYLSKNKPGNIPQNIQTPKSSVRPRSKLEELIQHKKEFDQTLNSPHELKSKEGMSISKILVSHAKGNQFQDAVKKQSEPFEQNQLISGDFKVNQYNTRTPILTHHRENLLDERKYVTAFKTNKNQKKYKIINHHSRSRRQKSPSITSQIDSFMFSQRNSRHWLQRWFMVKDQLQLGEIYAKFVEVCLEKVKQMVLGFQSWHLFHKAGQSYAKKQEGIEFRYSMQKNSNYQQEDGQIFKTMSQMQFLWNCVNQYQIQSSDEYKIEVPLACLITFKGLSVFCKADLDQSAMMKEQITDFQLCKNILNKISASSKVKLRPFRLYSIVLGKNKHLYIDSAEVKPYLLTSQRVSINEYYLKNFVEGVVSSEIHIQQITDHVVKKIIPDIIKLLEQVKPLSSLELMNKLAPFGVDFSVIPLLYSYSLASANAKRLILSELCAELMISQIVNDIKVILLTKNTSKLIEQHIYRLISCILRLDDDRICGQMLSRYQISISLSELKNGVIDEYVISSLLIKLGLRCDVKAKGRLESIQNLGNTFWRQLEFTQQNVDLTFEPVLCLYNWKHFNPQSKFLEEQILQVDRSKINSMSEEIVFSKLNKIQGQFYCQSASFKLLPVCEKQKINLYLSKFDSQLVPNQPSWEDEQSNPFFHLFHFPVAYYYCYQSFLQVCQGIKQLIKKKSYHKAQVLIIDQLYRAWIWGKHNNLLLMQIQDLAVLVYRFAGNQLESLQSCLLSLQICIKNYERGQFEADIVLDKAFRAATIHSKCGREQRAIQLFSTCQPLFEQLLNTPSRLVDTIQNYLSLFNQKSSLYLKAGVYSKAEQSLCLSLSKFFSFKQKCQNKAPQLLRFIFEEQFECYCLLFRVYELQRKKIEMIQLMEDCSVKYVENYIEILLKKKKVIQLEDISRESHRYFKEIVKNVWIAVVLSCHQWQISTYQHYFNHHYAPLRVIELTAIKNIILYIRKYQKNSLPLEEKEAIHYCFDLIASNLSKYREQQASSKIRPKSILVVAVIDCLSILSETDLAVFKKQVIKSKQWLLFQSVLSCLGYEFAVGAIEGCLNSLSSQF